MLLIPQRRERIYLILTTLFSVIVILSNLITFKIIRVPLASNLGLPAGIVTFPLIFLMSDLVTEIYGSKRARFMVHTGFAMSFVAHLIIQLALCLPPYEGENQRLFQAVFGINGIVIYSSMLAYLVSQILDIQLYALFKRLTKGNHLWFRNNASTLISQLVDTFIVYLTFLYWGLNMEFWTVMRMIGYAYMYKCLMSVSTTPIFYIAVAFTKKFMPNKPRVLIESAPTRFSHKAG